MDNPSPRLPFDEPGDALARRDARARAIATDPRRNVVLEASAGTGKTTVLVNRYLNLVRAGVDPANILAITFTRKAAAEMRQRIVGELQRASVLSAADAARWHDLRDRPGDIAVCTIDAFCLSLLREFPLEAGLDPGFDVADETLIARVKQESLDRTLGVCRRLAARDETLRVLVALLGEARLRGALEHLLDRRLVARGVLRRFAGGGGVRDICGSAASRVARAFDTLSGGLKAFLDDGPRQDPAFEILAADLERLVQVGSAAGQLAGSSEIGPFRAALDSVRAYFLTRAGDPRKRPAPRYDRRAFDSPDAWRRHAAALAQVAPSIGDALAAFDRDLNRVLARGVRRAFEIARYQFRRQLDQAAVLDFSEVLARTLTLLGRMDEFSQSRYRLESRYHHVLVDEFQDTSRAQWRLVSLLVKSWGEGAGLAGGVLPPSIFVVGDRKQSIYGFRDTDATILGLARRDIEALRPAGRVYGSISRSFRSAPALLAFANDLFGCMEAGTRPDRFRYRRRDAFPIDGDESAVENRLGLIVADSIEACASAVADEIRSLLAGGALVRDPRTGTARAARPADIAVLFRSREGHQEYERALAARDVAAYVYKGLGFFDADETKDVLVLVDYLARPDSDLAAAAWLRSRLVRLSDAGLQRLAPDLAAGLRAPDPPQAAVRLDAEDCRVYEHARRAVAAWLPLVDRLTPAEVVDRALEQCAYASELHGARRPQARENLKKMRALVRRIQNRGYATMADVAEHLRVLSAGDESNAVVDAVDAVNLMTVHAAKGLEFPVVFLVNLSRGTGGGREAIRVVRDRRVPSVSVGDFTSAADAEASEREVEETKRLLYVAVTRARDRLYLCSPLKTSRFSPHPRSLGWVLPASFAALFSRPPSAERSTIRWQAPSGRTHAIAVCPVGPPLESDRDARLPGSPEPGATGPTPAVALPGDASTVPQDAFSPLRSAEIPRIAVTELASEATAPNEPHVPPRAGPAAQGGRSDQPVLGLLVHRLFQYLAREDAAVSHDDLRRRARALLAASERSALETSDVVAGPGSSPTEDGEPGREEEVARRAADAIDAIRSDPRVRPLLGDDHQWLHEVPFSMAHEGMLLRGVIDLLVVHDDRVTVVEVKTGGPRPDHARQLEVYRSAAERLFPGQFVDAVLLYAGQ